ncbi:hypothetical protein ACFFSW_28390 [Saccharothrix longispora]|uniref:Excreted virulence factor EspC (Type VII ESX diderm) n=1 Tax=Saccharothrix longispora TaxID=33920 RepID=A0ABU1Q2B0_9PSEU|nr:hypothetical protein [Saccharothrix longispora]MDR6596653.1 hypothetical protein [Saccharothrix longispora]
MSGFEVDVEGLRAAAASAASAGERARRVGLGEAVGQVPAGLPGSRSADRAERLARAWDDRVAAWSRDVGAFSANLSASADRYAADDAASARDFSGVLPGGLVGWS